jgi:cytochrome c
MKSLTLLAVLCLAAAVAAEAAEDGQSIFKSNGCMSCHRPESSSKVNPSLSEIAQAYQGKSNQLADYLSGAADPIVRPERAAMMKRYLEKTRAMSAEERKALAEFILSHTK